MVLIAWATSEGSGWMSAHARLKNGLTEDKKCKNPMSWSAKIPWVGSYTCIYTIWQSIFQGLLEIIEPAHEIMALFVLRKLIFQTRMRSHPVGLDVWLLVGPFVYFHSSCVRTAKALVRLRGCAGSPEPSLVTCAVSTKISWAGSNGQINDWVCVGDRGNLKLCLYFILFRF